MALVLLPDKTVPGALQGLKGVEMCLKNVSSCGHKYGWNCDTDQGTGRADMEQKQMGGIILYILNQIMVLVAGKEPGASMGNILYDGLRHLTGIGALLIILFALLNPKVHRNIKLKRHYKKIVKLHSDVTKALKLCENELVNRRNGIPGESTEEQLEEVVIPELKEILSQINGSQFPEKEQRKLRFLSDARVYWGWNTRNPTELFALLIELNEEYHQLLD